MLQSGPGRVAVHGPPLKKSLRPFIPVNSKIIYPCPTPPTMRSLLLAALLLGCALLAAAQPRMNKYGNSAEARAAAAELKALVSQCLGDRHLEGCRSAAWPLPSVHLRWTIRVFLGPMVQRQRRSRRDADRCPSFLRRLPACRRLASGRSLTQPPVPSHSHCSHRRSARPCSRPGRPITASNMRMALRR